ncbi:MAG TPA: hypothetical protein VGJ70_06880, partial [Solirubrobacteraceae bacterium]
APPTATVVAVPTATAAVAPTNTSMAVPAAPPGTATARAGAELVRVGQAAAREVAPAPDGALFVVAEGGLFKAGAGGTPERRAAAAPPPNLLALDGERLVGGAMIACMRGGGGTPLQVSEDGGRSWRQASQGGKPLEATPWLARPGEVYALSCGGVHRSRDGGRTYEVTPQLAEQDYDPKELALGPDGATAYAAGVSEGGTVRVIRAERRGEGWSAATPIETTWAAAALAVGADGRVWLGTSNDVRVSADRGASWRSMRQGLEAELLASDPTKGQLTADDQRKLREGYGLSDLAVVGASVYAATSHGVYVGPTWRKVAGPSGKVTKLQVAGQTLYATTADGVYRIAT